MANISPFNLITLIDDVTSDDPVGVGFSHTWFVYCVAGTVWSRTGTLPQVCFVSRGGPTGYNTGLWNT